MKEYLATMKKQPMAIDWTKLQKRHKGLWIALTRDEKTVLGSAKSAKEALLEARKKGVKKPVLTRMPEVVTPYVGQNSHLSL